MTELFDAFRALMLLSAANATPILIARLAQGRFSAPLDFGCTLADGERLLGSHKTWRGLLSGVASCAAIGMLVGVPLIYGVTFGCVSLLGDALSSAVKRRLHAKPGTEYIGLDQIGEALLPLIVFAKPLSLNFADVLAVTFTFVTLDLATERIRHRGLNNKG
ncbi:MAG TPA: CDP-archaeol synthase [Steroidobacteraceae bacterium]|jgi:hypothetical protein|nr:CDP-archaeol synthase [Steroidobacteraceae bacterium]